VSTEGASQREPTVRPRFASPTSARLLIRLANATTARFRVLRVIPRLRCQAIGRDSRTCGGKPDLVTLVRGRERQKDFLVLDEITVLDDRLRISD
jgi:uncharacterized protein with von Willebrand factor type A (vWA) domain